MKQLLRTLAFVLVATMGWTSQANADSITINFTADNIVDGGLCTDMNCTSGVIWSVLGAVSNLSDWKASDSVTIDLGPGTYYFAWSVENLYEVGGPGNPAGLLAEILWGGGANYSSTGWEVDDGGGWISATSYGANGGANIWTGVNGGPVAGISTNAEWLWTDLNGDVAMDQSAVFRTSITITAVPEPGTLLLLGIGLLGMGIARRKKV